MAAAASLVRADRIILKTMDPSLGPFDVTWSHYDALVLLSFTRSGNLTLDKLDERLLMHPTSVTNIINRLEDDGLVECLAHSNDRRTRGPASPMRDEISLPRLQLRSTTRSSELDPSMLPSSMIRPGNCRDFSSWKRMEHDKQFIAEAIPR